MLDNVDNRVLQSGTVTPRHVAIWTTDGVVEDGGTSAESKLTSLGITAAGDTSFAINDASVTEPYSAFSLGINPTNGALISVDSFNGAPLLGLHFRINGNLSNLFINPDGTASVPAGGPFLPLTGGTVTGATTFSATVTHTGTPAAPSAGQGNVGGVSANGLVLTGNGSTNDAAIQNRAGLNALLVIGNTTTVRVPNANSNAPSLVVGGGGATSLANGMTGLFNVANTANFTGTTGAGKNIFLSSIQFTGDQIDSSAGSAVNGLFLSHNWGGGSTRGGRIALNVTAIQSAPSLSTSSRFYQAFAPSIQAQVNDGGAIGDYRGKYFVMNPIVQIGGGATYVEGAINTELDVEIQATLFTGSISGATLTVTGGPTQGVLAIGQTVTGPGVTPFAITSGSGATWTLGGSQAAVGPVAMSALGQVIDKAALLIVQLSTDAVLANRINSAIRITNQGPGTAPGWTQGITFGDENGWWPMTSTGTLVGTRSPLDGGPSYAAAIGIDFSAIAFSVTPIKLPAMTDAANDAAAATAGIPVGGFYRNGSIVMQRVT